MTDYLYKLSVDLGKHIVHCTHNPPCKLGALCPEGTRLADKAIAAELEEAKQTDQTNHHEN